MKTQTIFRVIAATLGFIVGLECGVRLGDPARVYTYLSDTRQFHRRAIQEPGRYLFGSGYYDLGEWFAWIDSGHRRVTPDSGAGACVIAFIGDSFTFGRGVSDNQTWVNLVAAQYPVTIKNLGVPGYNINQVYTSMIETPADGYIYLVYDNDPYPAEQLSAPYGHLARWYNRYPSALGDYWFIFTRPQGLPDMDMINFNDYLGRFAERDNVFMFALGGGGWKDDLTHIDNLQAGQRISLFDDHANAAGNQYIAEQVKPLIDPFINSICQGIS